MLRMLCIAASIAFAPAAHATSAEQMEANKKAVAEFYELAVNKKDFEAATKFLGPRYVQHNPNAPDGPEGLKAYIALLRDKFPDAHSDVIRVFADGDYVIHHVHSVPTPGSRGDRAGRAAIQPLAQKRDLKGTRDMVDDVVTVCEDADDVAVC